MRDPRSEASGFPSGLAFLRGSSVFETDILIMEAVSRLEGRGVSLSGIVPNRLKQRLPSGFASELRVLPTSDVIRCESVTAPHGMQEDAIQKLVPKIGSFLLNSKGLVLNAYTTVEAQGRGFAPLIGAAQDLRLPVILGVRDELLDNVLELVGGVAKELISATEAVDWLLHWVPDR